jgi:hypothetical protein
MAKGHTRDTSDQFGLRELLSKLERIGEMCSVYSAIVGGVTLIHFAVAAFSVYSVLARNIYFPGLSLPLLIVVFDGGILIFAILMIWRFDKLARHGNLIYQEVSDELENQMLPQATDTLQSRRDFLSKRELLQTRIILRRFVLNATLPFYRKAENGPAFYIGANGILTLFTWSYLLSLKL